MDKKTRPVLNALFLIALLVAGGAIVFAVQSLVGQVKPAHGTQSAAAMSIHDAASRGDAAGVRAEIARGVDANLPVTSADPKRAGMTPLICAAYEGNAATITVLLDAKARPSARTDDGKTALMFAAGWGDVSRVNAILQSKAITAAGVDVRSLVNARADGGWTALMFAAARGSAESVHALLDAGAEVDARNKWSQTALMAAARAGDPRKIAAIVDAHGAVNAVDADLQTPLAIAASSDVDPEILRVLVDAGAEINAPDRDGVTPLMQAAYRGDAKQARLLLDHKADPRLKDHQGRTAKDWAISRDDDQGRQLAALLEAAP